MRYLWFLLVLLPLFLLPFPFYLTLLNFFALSALVALSLYVLTGLAGMTSFAQAAFMGMGAYATALLTVKAGLSPWLGLLAGLLLSLLLALVLGGLTVRLKGHFLPLSTIAWQVALYILAGNLVGLTGGHTGITDLPPLTLFGYALDTGFRYALFSLFLLVLFLLALDNLRGSRLGRALLALRGDALAAASFGVDPARLRLQAFLLAGGMAGVAGFLYAHFLRFVNPTPFSLEASIKYLVMAVAGGVGTIPGVVLGAAFFTGLEDWLKDLLPLLLGRQGNYEVIGYGLILALILLLAPKGLWPLLAARLPRKEGRLPEAEPLPLAPPQGAKGEEVLRVEGLKKAFGGLLAVNGVSFALRRGEILALIGPNGAGKSTTFNLVTGTLIPDGGKVFLFGREVTGLAPFRIHRLGLGRTFQHPHLFPELSVLENAALGTYARTRAGFFRVLLGLHRKEEDQALATAYRALKRVGLESLAWERAERLTVGQQRLLEIARLLASGAAVLLLDEPGAGLRAGEKRELAHLLRSLAKEGYTVLLVDHDMDLIMGLADRVVVMNYGEKIAEGTPAEVQRNPLVRAAYLGEEVA
ncbi:MULTISPECIES: branched-chain amino acid ABC transporter ATP-binding protein/permease [Thermus]|jgi:branched-chain amino acid transport system permease protein|uniref:Branched-chain amino acid ABC transporter ATP-binding protein n=1 Tax=Thermus brockianus TaxID=56956 RepID=A0A1J0LPW1_THEBO|nr:branched-chain amino acid ABC transporter ATP-binding protein/permease [Thermus brockianus]APD08345.1 branched-chain amino acid ABC transporter ATP-binding protein [Thermus brockianus]BDG16310.1 metal-dependent hydrolase [Thermus brockianus]